MIRLPKSLLVAVVAAAIALYAARIACVGSAPQEASAAHQASPSGEAVEDGFVHVFADVCDTLAREREAQAARSEDIRVGGVQQAGVGVAGNAGLWGQTSRSSIDLAIAVLAGSYSEKQLLRHVLLNPEDRPIDDDRCVELAALVARLHGGSRQLRAYFQQMGLADRRAVLEGGAAVPEVEIPAAEAERAAKRIVAYYEGRGERITEDEARARLRRREAFSVKMPANTSYIDGRLYPNAAFSRLPRCDAAFEYLRQAAMEEAALIVQWFALYGYTSFGSEVMSIFHRMETITRLEFERVTR